MSWDHGNALAVSMMVVRRVIGRLLALGVMLAAPAYAVEVFDPPFGGLWVCPDGHAAVRGCMPPEFNGVQWWKACFANRTDCAYSDTAIVGWDFFAKRGPGYCYTQQPYTCSPNGTWPP